MWYLIIAIITGILSHCVLYAYHKSKRRPFSYAQDFQVGVVLFPFLLGLGWPVTLVSMLCIVLFKTVLEKPYNKFIDWLVSLIKNE